VTLSTIGGNGWGSGLDRGRSFLLERRGDDGLWRDFRTLAGQSADWVTGYVGYNLLRAAGPTVALEHTALTLVERQQHDGGWGYNETVPSDADSTAYVLLFLSGMGATADCIHRATRCLRSHQDPDSGGVATYREPGPIRDYMGLPPEFSFEGWCQPHVEVTAAAGRAFAAAGSASSPLAEKAWRFVTERRQAGHWESYWWVLPHYPTLQCVELTRSVRGSEDTPRLLDATVAWLRETQLPGGGWAAASGQPACAFATALSISVLALACAAPAVLERGVDALLRLQEQDGGWWSEPSLQIPPPDVPEPGRQGPWRIGELGTGVLIADENRLYTTATCVGALALTGALTSGGRRS
jgi:squalene cyclase